METPPNPLRDIFVDACEIKDEQLRAAFLDSVCGTNASLRHEVEELLGAQSEAGRFLPEHPAPAALRQFYRGWPERLGDRIGPYRLVRQLGEGGCGLVYMAEQERPVRRDVALKVIKLGMDTRQVIARFEAERQVLALMDHPHIAKVLDAGATEAGRPYFVMELVKGIPITRYCDENKLGVEVRLRLFIQVCQGIQHAHQKGVIHRDIKPSNILVAEHDGVPLPKIIDFGIAKATTREGLTDPSAVTACEQFLGTPAYMSPEQARLGGVDIDTRSDIYGLGVLLYELLTGKTPFASQGLLVPGWEEMRQKVMTEDPVTPSTRLGGMGPRELEVTALLRGDDGPGLVYLVRGDLDWIVMKALEKDRARRYETANGLARDVQRYLANEPVSARPPSRPYRLRKLIQRNKLTFAAAAVASFALLAGLGFSTWQFLLERQARRTASTAALRAETAESRTRLLLSAADFSQAVLVSEKGNGIEALAYLSRSLTLNPTNEAALTRLGTLLIYHSWVPPRLVIPQHGIMRSVAFSPDGKRVVTASDDGAARLWDADTGRMLGEPMVHTSSVRWVQFSPDGTLVATASFDHTARVWDGRTGQPVTPPLKHAGKVVRASFSPDGTRVATASDDETARIWDARTGIQRTDPLPHGHWVRSAEFSPDGLLLVSTSNDGTARIWNAATGKLLHILRHQEGVYFAQFSWDSRRVVTAGEDGARVWDAQTGEPVTALMKHGARTRSAQFSPDGRQVATASDDGTAQLWEAETGRAVFAPLRHSGAVGSVEFSPDGQEILTASFDGTATVWSAKDGLQLAEPLQNNGWVRAARFSPGARRIVTASDDEGAQIWGPRTRPPVYEPLKHRAGVTCAQFSPRNDYVLTASADGTARVWEAGTGKAIFAPIKHEKPIRSAQFSPDAKRIVTASEDQTARVWDTQTGALLLTIQQDGPVSWAEFSPDGTRLVIASTERAARIWSAENGQPITGPLRHDGAILWAHFSRDGRRVVTTSEDSSAIVWNAQTGRRVTPPLNHSGWVESAEFSPDGRLVVTASFDKTASVWDAETGNLVTGAPRHSRDVWSARFSPDGQRIVTASEDGTARVWNSHTGEPMSQPMRHKGAVHSAEFSPDGRRIVTAAADGSARVWDSTTGLPLTEPFLHRGPVRSAQFSAHGDRILTAADDGTAMIWDISPPPTATPQWLLLLAETLCGQVLNQQSVLSRPASSRDVTLRRALAELDRAPADDPWAQWVRWFLATPSTRTISPFSKISLSEYIANRLAENTRESLDQAESAAEPGSDALKRIQAARRSLEQSDNFR